MIPPAAHDYPYYWFILDPRSKKVKGVNLNKLPKFQIFHKSEHATDLLKLVDKMCKYEMDPASIVEDAERTRFCPQTDGLADKVKPVYPPSTSLSGGVWLNVGYALSHKSISCSQNHFKQAWWLKIVWNLSLEYISNSRKRGVKNVWLQRETHVCIFKKVKHTRVYHYRLLIMISLTRLIPYRNDLLSP